MGGGGGATVYNIYSFLLSELVLHKPGAPRCTNYLNSTGYQLSSKANGIMTIIIFLAVP